MKKILAHSGFSIIEVLVGILIFSLGLTGVFALISSSMRLNDYNKNHIIASNLAREQIELFKYIRDTNYATTHNWNQIDPLGSFDNDDEDFFSTGSYYTLENNFTSNTQDFSIQTKKITDFGEGKSMLTTKMQGYRLCQNNENIYTYDCSSSAKKTPFYRYLKISPIVYSSGGTDVIVDEAFKITAKVIWNIKGYHEVEIESMMTDWKRL